VPTLRNLANFSGGVRVVGGCFVVSNIVEVVGTATVTVGGLAPKTLRSGGNSQILMEQQGKVEITVDGKTWILNVTVDGVAT